MDPGAMAMMIPLFGILVGGLAIFTRSHIGHALAERISGRAGAGPELEADVRDLRNEVEALRTQLVETQERLDFTERMIASGSKGGVT